MSKNSEKDYNERFKRMKESIKKHADILESDFPDDVTVIGDSDLLKKTDEEIDADNQEGLNNGKRS